MTELGNLPFTWPKAGSSSAITGKRMTELAPTYLAAEHQGLRILFDDAGQSGRDVLQGADPQDRGLQGREDPLRRRAEQISASMRSARCRCLIQPPEAADALAKGIVDAAWFPHEAGVAYDLGTVTKFAIEPPISTATFALAMNPAKYNSLPADLKALIDKTTGVGRAPKASARPGRRRRSTAASC